MHFYDWLREMGQVPACTIIPKRPGAIAWPGEAMHADGDGWYTATIFGTQSARVLFNDGGSRQTPASGQEGHLVTAEAWCRNGVWTDTRPDSVLVMFHKPSGCRGSPESTITRPMPTPGPPGRALP